MAEQNLGSSVKQRPSKCTKLLVAAIDFGTVYSVYAYSFKSEWPNVMTSKWSGGDSLSYKTPSALLLNPDQSFNSFGFDAEKRYASLTEDGENCGKYFFFQRYKMILKLSSEKRVHRKTQCVAENGVSVDAMKVFTHCINYMRECLLKHITDIISTGITMDDIDFVLTVPATWDDTAKMFMREAAVKAGIKNNQLLIASEPEAAFVYCQMMHLESTYNERYLLTGKEAGEKYMVLDLGETTDITIHQLREDGTSVVSKIEYTSSWEKAYIEDPWHEFLISLFGKTVMNIFDEDPEYREDYFEFWRILKTKNEILRYDDEKFGFRIPLGFVEIIAKQNKQDLKKLKVDTIINDVIKKSQYKNDLTCDFGKLCMTFSFFNHQFHSTIENTLKKLYTDIGHDLKFIIMVGGVSNYRIIQESVKKVFEGKCRVIIPNQPHLAVVKGAIYSGHQPDMTSGRVSKYSYGIQTWPAFNETKHLKSKRIDMDDGPRCKDVFFTFVAKGDIIKPGARISYTFNCRRLNAMTMVCSVFISNKKNPKYVDEKGCVKLGTLTIPLDENDRDVDIIESLIFEDTELHITALNCANKMESNATFDLLSELIDFP